MTNRKVNNELKQKVLLALIDRGVFSKNDDPRVTKFQGGKFHLKSKNDSGKATVKGNVVMFDTIKFGSGETKMVENRNSDNPEVKDIIEKFNINSDNMESSIFVFDRKTGEVKEFKMKKSFGEMNNGIKAMQVQRVKNHINENDLILNTNLDRYIK